MAGGTGSRALRACRDGTGLAYGRYPTVFPSRRTVRWVWDADADAGNRTRAEGRRGGAGPAVGWLPGLLERQRDPLGLRGQ